MKIYMNWLVLRLILCSLTWHTSCQVCQVREQENRHEFRDVKTSMFTGGQLLGHGGAWTGLRVCGTFPDLYAPVSPNPYLDSSVMDVLKKGCKSIKWFNKKDYFFCFIFLMVSSPHPNFGPIDRWVKPLYLRYNRPVVICISSSISTNCYCKKDMSSCLRKNSFWEEK